MDPERIVLFDGVCNLCNGWVRFIVRRDSHGVFRFAALQTEVGQWLQRRHGFDPQALDTVILIEDGQVFTRSDAALSIVRHLPRPWRWLSVFRFLPRFLRDAVYRVVANNRYRWFGKRDTCMIPTTDLADRFLDIGGSPAGADPRESNPPASDTSSASA